MPAATHEPPLTRAGRMPIEHIPDGEARLARQDAFWDRAILDRPVACIAFPKAEPVRPLPPEPGYATTRERWMDAETRAARHVAQALNTDHCGDALPLAWPNLGPEIFSAFFGTELEFGDGTSWSIPNLTDWDRVEELRFSEENPYWKTILEMTDIYLEAGRGVFYTGITDIHPGGDAIAAFRDPQELNVDMIECPEAVKALTDRVTEVFKRVYGTFADKLLAAGQAVTAWPGIVSTRRWYVPSNDFSCMISKEMFDEVFLPGIAEECRHLEASIYHLDGPGALRHLDSLLAIPELNAIQWVYGAGQGRATDWLDVYRRCQDAGKGVQIMIDVSELRTLMDALRPEGVWLGISGITDREGADAALRTLSRWH